MVAYNFQPKFVEPIRNGTKTNTIRLNGKRRHARPGDALQLYRGMRTRRCEKIRDAVCTDVKSIRIHVSNERLESVQLDGAFVEDLNAFAKADGFVDAGEMWAFWVTMHGVGFYEGTFISWSDER